MLKAREERALRKKQDVERAAEFVRKAEEAQEKLDMKRAEEEETVDVGGSENGARRRRGIEKRRMEFLEMEEKRFRLEAKKKIEALEERERRREKETRRLNDLKWRESLEAQVAEKEQRELDMAIGNMSLREMRLTEFRRQKYIFGSPNTPRVVKPVQGKHRVIPRAQQPKRLVS